MGFFNKEELIKLPPTEKYRAEIRELLIEGEQIEAIYQLMFDYLCFTDKRLIFVDKDVSFKEPKTTINSVPYSNINSIGLQKNQKVFAFMDEIVVSTRGKNYDLKFVKGTDIKDVYMRLTKKII